MDNFQNCDSYINTIVTSLKILVTEKFIKLILQQI
jgi:hypothetical protein